MCETYINKNQCMKPPIITIKTFKMVKKFPSDWSKQQSVYEKNISVQ